MISSYVNESILGRAQKGKKIKISYYNPRDFTKDKHKKVDNIPYGGGPGMVMTAEPILRAVQKAQGKQRAKKAKVILFSPRGKKFTNKDAQKLAKEKHLILISGRYEGIDARVEKVLKPTVYSVGDYVLTGGELPTNIVIDAVSRHVPGVLGDKESVEENRIAGAKVYTRPETLTWKKKNHKVPKVLLSGDHKKIDEWREKGK